MKNKLRSRGAVMKFRLDLDTMWNVKALIKCKVSPTLI